MDGGNVPYFSLGRADIFSYGDLGLRNAIKKVYKLKKQPTERQAEKLAAQWKPYRSLASRYLWASLDNTHMIIDGKKIADEIIARLKKLHARESFSEPWWLAMTPPRYNFLKQKERVAKELGIEFRLYQLSEAITTDKLRQEIGRFAEPKHCGGFIVQLPLPEK